LIAARSCFNDAAGDAFAFAVANADADAADDWRGYAWASVRHRG
jgi:hypothetical protein